MSRAHDEIRLSPEEFRQLKELFNQHCGLQFGPESRLSMERRLRERIVVLNLQSFGEYYAYLRYHQRGRSELEEALDVITVNETYFFREDHQLRALRNEIVPMLIRSGSVKNRLQIWSAGCSTGEEVYSIGIVAREARIATEREVRIFGSDISRRCVSAARKGVYGASSFRVTPPEIRRRYFEEHPDGAHVVDELRALCQFGHLNLLDASRAAVVSRVDIIFCRNVLIYLDEASRRKVIDIFYERLLPGGFLLLGHSESLLNVSTAFELVHLREDLVYRKPAMTFRLSAETLAGLAASRNALIEAAREAARPGSSETAHGSEPSRASDPDREGEPARGGEPARATSTGITGGPGTARLGRGELPAAGAPPGITRGGRGEALPAPAAAPPSAAGKSTTDAPHGMAAFQKPNSSV